MIKKIQFSINFVILCVILNACVSTGNNNSVLDLDKAILESCNYLNQVLQQNKRLVILNIQSDSTPLSEYIIDEITANIVNTRKYTIVERQQLDIIRNELGFQFSGEVSDESALGIGRMLGAEIIITGAISRIGNNYRLRVRALGVEKATVEGQFNQTITDTRTITALMNNSNNNLAASNNSSQVTTSITQPRLQTAGDYNTRGRMFFEREEYEQAILDFTEALILNPRYDIAFNNRGLSYIRIGDFDRAIRDLTQAITYNPNYVEAYHNRGVAYENKKDYDRAISDFSMALRLDPNFEFSRIGLQNARRARGY